MKKKGKNTDTYIGFYQKISDFCIETKDWPSNIFVFKDWPSNIFVFKDWPSNIFGNDDWPSNIFRNDDWPSNFLIKNKIPFTKAIASYSYKTQSMYAIIRRVWSECDIHLEMLIFSLIFHWLNSLKSRP